MAAILSKWTDGRQHFELSRCAFAGYWIILITFAANIT